MSTLPDIPDVPAEFSQQALTLMVQIRELGRTVEGFHFARKGRRLEIGNVSSLKEEFLHLLAAALDVNPDLAAAGKITAKEIREALNFKREFTNAANETRVVAKGMDDTIAERMAELGGRALRVYYYAKRADLKGENKSLVPHLKAMQRALGRGRRKKVNEGDDPAAPAKTGGAK